MKRVVTALVAVAVLAAAATGVLVWKLSDRLGPHRPQVTAFSGGHLVRVDPYRFCDVYRITDCDITGDIGVLPVTGRNPIQLSVPRAVSRAPWVLLRAYEGADESGDDTVVEEFRPDSRLAVTVPTVDPHHGRLTGLAVLLPTLVRDETGAEFPFPHAEWSVRTVWS